MSASYRQNEQGQWFILFPPTLLENVTHDDIAKLYVAKFSTISFYFTLQYVT